MSAEALSAIQTIWPRNTAKLMARRWGRAVVTCKQWLKNGVPEYVLQTVLADLDQELEIYERDLMEVRATLRKARHEKAAAGTGGALGIGPCQRAPAVHQALARGRQGANAARSVAEPPHDNAGLEPAGATGDARPHDGSMVPETPRAAPPALDAFDREILRRVLEKLAAELNDGAVA